MTRCRSGRCGSPCPPHQPPQCRRVLRCPMSLPTYSNSQSAAPDAAERQPADQPIAAGKRRSGRPLGRERACPGRRSKPGSRTHDRRELQDALRPGRGRNAADRLQELNRRRRSRLRRRLRCPQRLRRGTSLRPRGPRRPSAGPADRLHRNPVLARRRPDRRNGPGHGRIRPERFGHQLSRLCRRLCRQRGAGQRLDPDRIGRTVLPRTETAAGSHHGRP